MMTDFFVKGHSVIKYSHLDQNSYDMIRNFLGNLEILR